MGIEITPPGPAESLAPATSLGVYGSVTGPAAGATIAAVTTPAAGAYSVTVYVELTGTVAAADQDNLQLFDDNVVVTRVPASASISSGNVNPQFNFQVVTDGIHNIIVKAAAAGTGTAVYNVTLVVTRVE